MGVDHPIQTVPTGLASDPPVGPAIPLVAIAIDSGSYMCFNELDEQWEVASAHDGMTISAMQNISSADWASFITGATTIHIRFTLTTASDGLEEFRIEFTMN